MKNKWGLHLGNEVRCIENGNVQYGILNAIRGNNIRIKYTEGNDGRWYSMDNSKPVCRSLDSITAVEQVEFAREFLAGVALEELLICVSGWLRVGYCGLERPARVPETLWCIAKGFYVGQFEEGKYILKGEHYE
jgi:hypothetical protein